MWWVSLITIDHALEHELEARILVRLIFKTKEEEISSCHLRGYTRVEELLPGSLVAIWWQSGSF